MSATITLPLGAAVAKYLDAVKKPVLEIVKQQEFIAQTRVHFGRQFDKAINAGQGLQEGDTAKIRGQDWKGWAIHDVVKYGETVQEGTRWRFRKWSRTRGEGAVVRRAFGAEAAQAYKDRGGTLTGKQRTAQGGPSDEELVYMGPGAAAQKVKDREFEKVWNKRASKALYSASSKLLRDTGVLKNAVGAGSILVTATAIGLEYRPGPTAKYFGYQNARRPIFVIYLPDDEGPIAAILVNVIKKMLAASAAGGATP